MSHVYIVIHGAEYENSWPTGSRAFNTMSEAVEYADGNYKDGLSSYTEVWEYCINTDDEPNVYSRHSGEWVR